MNIWGWEIPVYLFLGGLAAGLMIVSSIPRTGSRAMRLLPFAVPIILSIGMFALFLDLENKVHVFRFYTAFRVTSPMSWGAWILLLIYPASIALGLARLEDAEIVRIGQARFSALCASARRNITAIERINIALGVALGAYTGILLGTLAARALWSSMMLAPLFLVSGCSAGLALAMLLPVSDEERQALRRWDIAAIAGEAVALGMLFLDLIADGGARGRAAAALLLGGPYTATFWSLVVIAGLAVPLLLELFEARRSPKHAALAPLLLLFGGLALRWIFVFAGQASV